jgi:gluconate 5-dehydrogenase
MTIPAPHGRRRVQQLFDLGGRTALVTGGSRGLGLQIAEALGEAGARVLLSARKSPELEEAAAALRRAASRPTGSWPTSSQPDEIERLATTAVERLGRIDILVNNAGATWGAAPRPTRSRPWDKVMNINVRATFLLSQAVGRIDMIPRAGGTSSNVASIAGLLGNSPR